MNKDLLGTMIVVGFSIAFAAGFILGEAVNEEYLVDGIAGMVITVLFLLGSAVMGYYIFKSVGIVLEKVKKAGE